MKLVESRQCFFCKSEEGLPRPVGNYIVELKELETSDGVKQVCQSCYLNRTVSKKNNFTKNTLKERLINHLKNIF